MNGVIIEGLSGTGKSTLVKLLQANPLIVQSKNSRIRVFDEDLTLGELVTEMRTVNIPDSERCNRLLNLLPPIEQAIKNREFVLLERFHLSYFALMPTWSLVQQVDDYIARLNIGLVLLHFPDNLIESRCFSHPENPYLERELINWYSTKQKAIEAFTVSQQNRCKAITLTGLQTLTIDTGKRNWQSYTNKIASFIT